VDNVRHEYDMLKAAKGWDGCIGGGGIFWEPWFGKNGARKGTMYHLGMKCAPCPASCFARSSSHDCVGPFVQGGD